jgi:hypothetical protein
MVTRANGASRVDVLASLIRESVEARGAKYLQPVGPRRQIVSSRVYVVDVLDCGHEVPAKRGASERRACPLCPRSR